MATIAENIEAIQKAISMGTESVEIGDKRIKYRSVGDLFKALAYWQGQLDASTGASARRYSLAVFYRDETDVIY